MALENVFSWSKSRDEEFRECLRKYFYNRYASWGGWERTAPREARQAYILKNLKNRWAWKGERVHHVIEHVLKSVRAGKPVPYEAAAKHLTDLMRADFRSSKAKKNQEDPKRNIGLFEHEYEKPVTDETWKKIHDEAALCLKNFYGSAFFKELSGDDTGSWLAIEDLEDYGFDRAKIFVKLDFARKKDGVVEIYDWKTGKSDPEGAKLQIGAYALYAMERWNVPLGDIRAYLFNLSAPLPVPDRQAINEDLLALTRKAMTESIAAMRGLLADPVKNIPKPRENFPFTENVRLCDFCNFYKICEKWQKPA